MVRVRMETTGTHSLDAWADLALTLRRYARGLTGSADAADDLTQQTIARLLARSPQKAAHLGYAYAAMTRVWLDEQRSLSRRMARLRAMVAGAGGSGSRSGGSNGGGGGAGGASSFGGHATSGLLEAGGSVARALDRLPPRRRAVLVLKAVEGLSYEQISVALGCTVATVRGELHEARRAMRSTLKRTSDSRTEGQP